MKHYSENPRVWRKGKQQRPRHSERYYTANASIQCSPGVKQGLVDIANDEGRDLSWVVNEVFRMFFRLRDDTPRRLSRTRVRQLRRKRQ